MTTLPSTATMLQTLASLFGGEVLPDGVGDAYDVPFEAWIDGQPRMVTCILDRTVVYEVSEDDRRLALFADVLVDPDLVTRRGGVRKLRRYGGSRTVLESKACEYCGVPFLRIRPLQRFCSLAHHQLFRRQGAITRVLGPWTE